MSNTFQSTLPARGATIGDGEIQTANIISIHAPRTGSDQQFQHIGKDDGISIHAPRTGSDREADAEVVTA